MLRETLTEREVMQRLEEGKLLFPPVCLRLSAREIPLGEKEGRADGILIAEWQQHDARFAFECKALSTPKALDTAMAEAQRAGKALDLNPMVIMPYLSEDALSLLEKEGVSGIDLSGNGVLLTPEMAVWRSGQPNRFKSSQPIRNVYRGISSLVARSFLLRSEFASLVELQTFAQDRLQGKGRGGGEGQLTKGTVSKVVGSLEEDKIIVREKGRLRLLSPQTLLDKLQFNVQKPQGRRIQGKTPLAEREMWQRLQESNLRAVTTGLGAAGYYRVLSGEDTLSLYVDDLDAAIALLDVSETSVFPNITLREYTGEMVYFDARKAGGARYASPIQTWLELRTAGPRERQAATVLEDILRRGEGDRLP